MEAAGLAEGSCPLAEEFSGWHASFMTWRGDRGCEGPDRKEG